MPESTESEDRAATHRLLALLPERRRVELKGMLETDDVRRSMMLMALLAEGRTLRKRKKTRLVFSACLLLLLAFFGFNIPIDALWPVLGITTAIALLACATHGCDGMTRVEMAVFEVALLGGDKHSIDVLLEGMEFVEEPRLRRRLKKRLAQLLLKVTDAHADQWTPIHRHKLCKLLHPNEPDTALHLAVLSALRHIGDHVCLGVVYQMATSEYHVRNASKLRQAAEECLAELGSRLDFGAPAAIGGYLQTLSHQLRAEGVEPQAYANSLLALRRLLPQLTPDNYRLTLSLHDRETLYELLPLALSVRARIRRKEPSLQQTGRLLEEILQTAYRLQDVQAVSALRRFVLYGHGRVPVEWEALHNLGQKTLALLEPLTAADRERTTLLRGASSPTEAPEELLRAVGPGVPETAPAELLRAAAAQPTPHALLPETAASDGKPILEVRSDA